MRIVDLMKDDAVILKANIASKEEMIDFMIDLHMKAGNIEDRSLFKQGILRREEEGPTAIVEGICIPHAKSRAVKRAGITAMTALKGIECHALDGQLSNLFFMIAAPEDGADIHLEALSRLSVLLMDDTFRNQLLSAAGPEEFLHVIDLKETEKYGKRSKKHRLFSHL